MAKLPDPTSSLDPQGQELYQQLVAQRGRIDGMYRSLLNHPELTRHVSDLGTFLRFGSGALPDALRELLILWVARELGAAYEWVKHEPVARQAGVSPAVIQAIRTRHEPAGLDDLQQAALAAAQCVHHPALHPPGSARQTGRGFGGAGSGGTGGVMWLL